MEKLEILLNEKIGLKPMMMDCMDLVLQLKQEAIQMDAIHEFPLALASG
jgi:hypothetical protein